MNRQDILEKVRRLNVNRARDRRAPHKPLLLLLAIAKLQEGVRQLSFSDLEKPLRELLRSYAPPVVNGHQPSLPYWQRGFCLYRRQS